MLRALSILLAAAVLAGCTASGDGYDPYAYTRKPLYTGGFDLARISGESATDEFRVSDGSIPQIHVFVWINATAGGATVTVLDPAGRTMLTTSETTSGTFGLNLGSWSVTATGEPGSEGLVHVLAVRG